MSGWDWSFRQITPEEEIAIDAACDYPYYSFKALVELMDKGDIRVPHLVSKWRLAAMIRQKINRHINPVTE